VALGSILGAFIDGSPYPAGPAARSGLGEGQSCRAPQVRSCLAADSLCIPVPVPPETLASQDRAACRSSCQGSGSGPATY
jgi:hypothetical protein